MENLELRKKVAEILGCKPYELDHHAAIDALMEFCEKRDFDCEISLHKINNETHYGVYIYRGEEELIEIQSTKLSMAICRSIEAVAAAESEKKEEER